MSTDVITMVNGKPTINGRPIELRKKGIVFLAIDLSDSMNFFVGPKLELTALGRQHGTPAPISPDGVGGVYIDPAFTKHLKTKLNVAVDGAKGFVDKAIAKKLVGIVVFGSSAEIGIGAVPDGERLKAALGNVEHHYLVGGSTNLAHALQLLFDYPSPIETVLVVTDGRPDDPAAALANGKLLKNMGTDILVIGTEDADWQFLNELRSRSDLSIRTSDEGLEQAITNASRLLKA